MTCFLYGGGHVERVDIGDVVAYGSYISKIVIVEFGGCYGMVACMELGFNSSLA